MRTMSLDHPAHPACERGSAIVLALVLVVAFGVLTTTMTQGSRRLATGSVDDRATLQALHAAEGGIEQARWQLQRDPEFAGGRLRIGDADVAVEVTALPGPAAGWQVRSIATCRPRGTGGLPVQRCLVADLVAGPGRANRSGRPAPMPTVRNWRERP